MIGLDVTRDRRLVAMFGNNAGQVKLAFQVLWAGSRIPTHENSEILDLSDFVGRSTASWRTRQVMSWIDDSKNNPSQAFRQWAASRHIPFHKPSWSETLSLDEARGLLALMPRSFAALEEWDPRDYGGIGRSLLAVCATEIARDYTWPTKDISPYLLIEIEAYLQTFHHVRHLLKHSDGFDCMCIFHGRLPAHAAASEAARQEGIDVLYFEGTPDKGFYFLSEFPANDPGAFEGSTRVLEATVTTAEKHQALLEFESRSKTPVSPRLLSVRPQGSFRKTRAQVQRVRRLTSRPIATIFTSSPDEFVSLGKSWRLDLWESQEDAIQCAASRLQDLGFFVQIRIHPNTLTKSWGLVQMTLSAYRLVSDRLYGPADNVNTYALLSESDLVVVWGSTVGLEASRMGIPTYVLGRTWYDSFADVRFLRDANSVRQEDFSPYIVDDAKALPAILMYVYQGHLRSKQLDGALSLALDQHDMRLKRYRALTAPWRLVDLKRSLGESPHDLRWIRPRWLLAKLLHVFSTIASR